MRPTKTCAGDSKLVLVLYLIIPLVRFGLVELRGAIHSTKIPGNFGLKLNGSVRSIRKSFEKISPPFEVDHFCWLDRFDGNELVHLTTPTHSQTRYLAVRHFPSTTWRKTLITAAFMDCQRIYRYNSYIHVQLQQVCSCFASQVYALAVDGS